MFQLGTHKLLTYFVNKKKFVHKKYELEKYIVYVNHYFPNLIVLHFIYV